MSRRICLLFLFIGFAYDYCWSSKSLPAQRRIQFRHPIELRKVFNHETLSFVPSNRNNTDWKEQRLRNRSTRHDNQAVVLITFGWISSMSFGIDFFCNQKCSSLILGFIHSNENFRGRNCRDFLRFVSLFFVFELVSWNYQLYFTNQAVNRPFLLEGFTKMNLGFVPCIGKLSNRSFLPVHVVMFSLETPTYLQDLRFFPRIRCQSTIFLLYQILLSRLSANAFQS